MTKTHTRHLHDDDVSGGDGHQRLTASKELMNVVLEHFIDTQLQDVHVNVHAH